MNKQGATVENKTGPEYPTNEQMETLFSARKRGGKGSLGEALDQMNLPKAQAEKEGAAHTDAEARSQKAEQR